MKHKSWFRLIAEPEYRPRRRAATNHVPAGSKER